jgi:hypothetical protein
LCWTTTRGMCAQDEHKHDDAPVRSGGYVDPLPYPAGTGLYSVAVAPSADGSYPYHSRALLIPHEGLRIELLRFQRIVDVVDPVAHPWKIRLLKEWFEGFLLPVVHDHHDNEGTLVVRWCCVVFCTFACPCTPIGATNRSSVGVRAWVCGACSLLVFVCSFFYIIFLGFLSLVVWVARPCMEILRCPHVTTGCSPVLESLYGWLGLLGTSRS